jgi:hypothetical protein
MRDEFGKGWLEIGEAGGVAAGPRNAGDEAATQGIGHAHEHDRDGACLVQQCGGRGRRIADEDVGSQGDQLLGEALRLIGAGRREAIVDADVAAFRPAEVLELLPECREADLGLLIVLGVADDIPTRRTWPGCCACAANGG